MKSVPIRYSSVYTLSDIPWAPHRAILWWKLCLRGSHISFQTSPAWKVGLWARVTPNDRCDSVYKGVWYKHRSFFLFLCRIQFTTHSVTTWCISRSSRFFLLSVYWDENNPNLAEQIGMPLIKERLNNKGGAPCWNRSVMSEDCIMAVWCKP